MRRGRRTVGLGASLVTYAALAISGFQAAKSPESAIPAGGHRGPLGPPALALERAAGGRLASGLAALNDGGRAPRERLQAYRNELVEAERLLLAGLEVRPLEGRALFRLAAVRWELHEPRDPDEPGQPLVLLELAARLAPTVPAVQQDIGRLCLRMGRTERALGYLAGAVQLQPDLAPEVVDLLTKHLLTAETIADALPADPEVLIALQDAYFAEGAEDAYARRALPLLDRPTPRLLGAFGTAHARIDAWPDLLVALESVGPYADAALEAERLLQRSRAELEAQDPSGARSAATEARRLRPGSPRYAEHLGHVELRLGQAGAAIQAFEETLDLLVAQSAPAVERGRLYREIGRAEEIRERPARAYDAYRHALALDPGDAAADQAIARMARAAGVNVPATPSRPAPAGAGGYRAP